MGHSKHVLSLPRGILGEFRLVWQAIGVMSIAADAAYLITGAAYFALGSLPLSIILGIVFYLFIMNTGYQFSRFISSAGSYYKFVAVSLGGHMGVFQAWNMAFYIIIGYASFGFLGLASFLLLTNLSYSIIKYWPLVVIAVGTISFLFTYFGIKVSTDYQILGGLLEIGTLLVGAIALIMMSGHSNTMLVFTTYFIKNNVYRLFQSMVYSVVLFFGTALAVTSLAEEAKQPEKSNYKGTSIYRIHRRGYPGARFIRPHSKLGSNEDVVIRIIARPGLNIVQEGELRPLHPPAGSYGK